MRPIDADVLRKSVNGVSTHWLNDWSTLGVLAMIDKQPTIDAVPVVHGYDTSDGMSLFRCSVCGWFCRDTYCGDTDTYNYCPNCGARMDGKENEE